MRVTYSLTAINARLNGVISTIDGGATNAILRILTATSTTLSTITLSRPCGTVSGGILTFVGTLLDPAAIGTGLADTVRIEDSNGNTVVSGLTVGIPLSGANVIMSNGLNSTLISSGNAVALLSAQIQGS